MTTLRAMALAMLPTLALAARGDLDPTFGTGGTVASTATIDAVTGLGLQPDGRIVVATSRAPFADTAVSAIVRYGSDGSPDPGFGDGGSVTLTGEFSPALLVEPDGSLVVATSACQPTGCVAKLRRYDRDGHPDATFTAPDRFVDAPTIAEVVARQADGKLVVGGNAGHAPAFSVWLARYAADGSSDATFGTQGVWTRNVSPHGSSLGSLVVDADDSFVVGTTGGTTEGVFSSIGRVTASADGASFVPTSFGYPLLALASDGGIVAAGTLWMPPAPGSRIALTRLSSALAADAAFGDAGTVTGPPGGPGGIALRPDGSLVVAAGLGDPDPARFALVSFTADGASDAGFGADGAAVAFPGQAGVAQHVVRQPDGRLLAAGHVGAAGAATLALARVLDDDAPGATTTTTPGATSTTTTSTTLPPAAGCTDAVACDDGDACTTDACTAGQCAHEPATGFDAVTCACDTPPPACASAPVTARMEKACALVARASDARTGRARRLIRRAVRLLDLDRRATAGAGGGGCDTELVGRVDDLRARTRQLLQLLR